MAIRKDLTFEPGSTINWPEARLTGGSGVLDRDAPGIIPGSPTPKVCRLAAGLDPLRANSSRSQIDMKNNDPPIGWGTKPWVWKGIDGFKGAERWVRESFYVPSESWTPVSGNIVYDWHASAGVNIVFRVHSGLQNFELVLRGGIMKPFPKDPVTGKYPSQTPPAGFEGVYATASYPAWSYMLQYSRYVGLGPILLDTWQEIIWHIKYSDILSEGFIEVHRIIDGVVTNIVPKRQAALLYNNVDWSLPKPEYPGAPVEYEGVKSIYHQAQCYTPGYLPKDPPVAFVFGGSAMYDRELDVWTSTAHTAVHPWPWPGIGTLPPATDIQPPTVNFGGKSPAGASTVSGTIVLEATAVDAIGVDHIDFAFFPAGGVQKIVASDTASPYIKNFDTRTVANGSYTMRAIAYDTARNTNTTSRTVTVDNTLAPPPEPPAPPPDTVSAPPANTVAPTITPTTVTTGGTLTTGDGTWTNNPQFTYQWRRAAPGATPTNISAATQKTYVTVAADEGQAISCRVRGTNALGSADAFTSNTVTPTAAAAPTAVPAFTTTPAITPTTAAVGQDVTVDNGVTNPQATAFAYQWLRGGTAIPSGAVTREGPLGNGFYGAVWAGETLRNLQVGDTMNRNVAFAFTADFDATINRVRVYFISGAGYSAGTGGQIQCEIRGTTATNLPGTTYAAAKITDPLAASFQTFVFATGFAMTRGTKYHLHFKNVDPSPTVNWVSLDNLGFLANVPAGTRLQPAIADTDLYARIKDGETGTWQAGLRNQSPIFTLFDTTGRAHGPGIPYVNARSQSGLQQIRGALRVAERFTPGEAITVTGFGYRIRKVGAPPALTIRLMRGATVLDTVTIPAANVATTASWVTGTFATAQTVTATAEHRFELSCPAGDAANYYETYPITLEAGMESSPWGFTIGDFQTSTDSGATWTTPSASDNSQLYFAATTAAANPSTNRTYTLQTADIGTNSISARVTPSNASGTGAPATAPAITVLALPPPPPDPVITQGEQRVMTGRLGSIGSMPGRVAPGWFEPSDPQAEPVVVNAGRWGTGIL